MNENIQSENSEEWGQGRTKEAYQPTQEQLVNPPFWLKGAALKRWLEEDLALAIGPEFLDHDGSQQPFIKLKRVRTPKEEPKPPESPQGELF